jgi:hypothetical protein
VLILCPSCRHAIRVRDLHPGVFTPRCPRCDCTFQLTVPVQPGKTPTVSALEPSVFAEPVPSDLPPPPAVLPPIAWPVEESQRGAGRFLPGALPRGTPRLLGGHLILRLLGHGPRGRAFLAFPISLGPPGVLKQAAADRADDPVFRAHHAREAFAAAQIEHPNVTQLREVGSARGRLFSVLDFIPGPSADQRVRDQGALEPYQATVVILQAARGLRAAHAQRLWHRDVKPANIRLSANGLARLDDLGLELTPSLAAALQARERTAGPVRSKDQAPPPVALVGTPAYMAPEQARDPVTIDGRADVYALGATYYHLVTGRPPFEGEDAVELLRRHAEEQPVPAREFVQGLPTAIAQAIRTMMGKRPEERYPNMGVVVEVLEGILDLEGTGASQLREESAGTIHASAQILAGSPARRVRGRILALSGLIGLACSGLLLALGLPWPALGILAFLGLTGAALAVGSGLLHRSEWLRLGAEFALGGGVRSWLILIVLAFVLLIALVTWGGFLAWFMICCAAGLAAAYHFFLDRPWAVIRRQALDSAAASVKALRVRGFAEDAIRALVADCGGQARNRLSGVLAAKPPATGGPTSRLRRYVQDSVDRRHQLLLERAEEGRLVAEGVNLLTARRRARRIAKAMLVTTREWRDELHLLGEGPSPGSPAPLLERLSGAAREPEPVLEPHEPQRTGWLRRLDAAASFLLGRKLRFLLGALLFGLLAYWLDREGVLTSAQVRSEASKAFDVVRRAANSSDPGLLRELRWSQPVEWRRLREPLDVAQLSEFVGNRLPAANVGIAGLVLWASLLTPRRITGLFALLGAVAILLGPRWGLAVPALLSTFDVPTQAMMAGLVLLAVGLLWPRRRLATT